MIKLDTQYICDRIAKLRTQEDISARELSLSLGQSKGYINTIENRKSLPSMNMFLYICEYFKITPKEFFDEDIEYPKLIKELLSECNKLDEETLKNLLAIVKVMNR